MKTCPNCHKNLADYATKCKYCEVERVQADPSISINELLYRAWRGDLF